MCSKLSESVFSPDTNTKNNIRREPESANNAHNNSNNNKASDDYIDHVSSHEALRVLAEQSAKKLKKGISFLSNVHKDDDDNNINDENNVNNSKHYGHKNNTNNNNHHHENNHEDQHSIVKNLDQESFDENNTKSIRRGLRSFNGSVSSGDHSFLESPDYFNGGGMNLFSPDLDFLTSPPLPSSSSYNTANGAAGSTFSTSTPMIHRPVTRSTTNSQFRRTLSASGMESTSGGMSSKRRRVSNAGANAAGPSSKWNMQRDGASPVVLCLDTPVKNHDRCVIMTYTLYTNLLFLLTTIPYINIYLSYRCLTVG